MRSTPGWCPLTHDVPGSVELDDAPALRSYGALLLPSLMGDAGLTWLGQEPVAMRELAACFGEGTSELRAIAVEAATRIGFAIRPPTPDTNPAAEQPCDDCEQADGKSPDCVPAYASEESGGGRERAAPVRGRCGAGYPRAASRADRRRGRGLALDQLGPSGFARRDHSRERRRRLAAQRCRRGVRRRARLLRGAVKNQVARLGRHRERKTPSGKASTFRAELADGRRIDGMVFPGDLFWDDDAPPEADGALGRRRR